MNRIRLGDVCLKIGSGATPRGGKETYKASGTALIRSQNVHNLEFSEDGLAFIDDEQAEALDSVAVLPGDVLLNITGDSVARVCQVPTSALPARVNQHVAIVRPDPRLLDTRFLLYSLVSPRMQGTMLALASAGATRNALTKGMIEAFEIRAPRVEEQRAIGRVLGALDDKIHLNRRMNRTLEAIAQALFRSWFIDFDPVHANRDGRPLAGLGPDVQAQFPNDFAAADQAVPQGWASGTVADLARYVNGKAFTQHAIGTGRLIIRIAELNSGVGGSSKYSTIEAEPDNTAYPDDLLFSWSGSLDVYRWHGDEAIINQHIFKVVPNDTPDWFVYWHLREAMPVFQAIAANKATTMGHIQRRHLNEVRLALPPASLLTACDGVMRPLYDMVHTNERQTRTLAELRDTLLPKLLSGEVRVRDAERELEAVT